MKGIIFDLLEQVVSDAYGAATWDTLLESAGLDGAYTAVGSYPDEQLGALVAAAATALTIEPDTLVRWFGRECIPILANKYPAFFDPHTTTRSFLMTLNEVIHPEVRKLFPGAYAPSFGFAFPSDDSLTLEYQSHRNLCSFAEGLIEGAAAHYGETVTIEQTTCAKNGGSVCTIATTFARATATA
ncbi:MAG TPA: heme NO-binding domain-containing protein [Rhodothermia bacterium]|nr:heme NO-binding domain-containing protein [Rhodothermia bacterium]